MTRTRVVTVKKAKRCPACAKMVAVGALGVLKFIGARRTPDSPLRIRSKLYHQACAFSGTPARAQ